VQRALAIEHGASGIICFEPRAGRQLESHPGTPSSRSVLAKIRKTDAAHRLVAAGIQLATHAAVVRNDDRRSRPARWLVRHHGWLRCPSGIEEASCIADPSERHPRQARSHPSSNAPTERAGFAGGVEIWKRISWKLRN